MGRRHEQDADRACDDMVESQVEIDKAEDEVPALAAKHRFYFFWGGNLYSQDECVYIVFQVLSGAEGLRH